MIRKALRSAIALSVAATAGQAFASGFALNEQSVSAMGTSYAGRSSSADDATTIYGNPAGMSRLKRQEISVGATFIKADTDIDHASGTFAGSNEGDMVPFTTVPNLYYVNPVNDRFAFGFGVYAPFGLITDYEGGFQGRYFGDYSEVKVITAQPTVSYKFNDHLSVGLGVTINRISGQLESAVPPVATAESRVKIKGDDTAIGFNAGVLYEFSPSTRAGLTYHSKVDYKLDGHTNISGNDLALGRLLGAYGRYDASLDLTLPEMADFSITHDINDQWTVYAGATFTRWSRLDSIVVENEGIPRTVQGTFGTIAEEQNWHDTWAYALGAAYKLTPQWTLRAGVAVDQSPTNNTDRSPRIPTGDRTAFSLGLGWEPTPDISVDVAYSYLKEEDTDINQASATKGTYNATYKNSASGLGAQLSYRF
jgi:long-chain fatty acid transport protein